MEDSRRGADSLLLASMVYLERFRAFVALILLAQLPKFEICGQKFTGIFCIEIEIEVDFKAFKREWEGCVV